MLSTSAGFSNRFHQHDYVTGNLNAHHYYIQNIEPTDIEDNINTLSNQSNVLCGHWASYYWLMQSDLSKHFNNRQILIIEPPKFDSVAHQRLTQYTNAYSDEYFYKEMKLLYTIDIMSKVFADDAFFVLNADLIFQYEINMFIENAEKEFCIKLNHSLCEQIHKQWFGNIIKEV